MGSVTYAFRGQRLYDERDQYLATLATDKTGKSVRWDAADFIDTTQDKNRVDLSSKENAARVTQALWRLRNAAGQYDTKSDWVV